MISERHAFDLLSPHFPIIEQAVEAGWDLWRRIPPDVRLHLDLRAQRSHTWCGMVNRAKDLFSETVGVSEVRATNSLYFSVDGRAILRFKKLDAGGTSANLMTQMQVALRDPQMDLGTDFGRLPFIDVGYVPNAAETDFVSILAAAPGLAGTAWKFPIPRASHPGVKPVPVTVERTRVRPVVIRIREAETGTEES